MASLALARDFEDHHHRPRAVQIDLTAPKFTDKQTAALRAAHIDRLALRLLKGEPVSTFPLSEIAEAAPHGGHNSSALSSAVGISGACFELAEKNTPISRGPLGCRRLALAASLERARGGRDGRARGAEHGVCNKRSFVAQCTAVCSKRPFVAQ